MSDEQFTEIQENQETQVQISYTEKVSIFFKNLYKSIYNGILVTFKSVKMFFARKKKVTIEQETEEKESLDVL